MDQEQETSLEELTPEEAKATLGLSTRLSEQFLSSQVDMQAEAPTEELVEEPQPETAPEQEEEPEIEEDAPEAETEDLGGKLASMELNLTKKLDEIRKEIKEDSQREIDSIKADIKNIVNDDET